MSEKERPANLRLASRGNSENKSTSEFNREIADFKASAAQSANLANDYVTRAGDGFILKDTPEALAKLYGPFAIYAACATCGQYQIFFVLDDRRLSCRPSTTPGEVTEHVVKLTRDDIEKASGRNVCLRFRGAS